MATSDELRRMILSFRVSELQDLLGFAGRNKTGKKQELQARALELLRLKSPPVQMKVAELHRRRVQVMNVAPVNPPPRDINRPMNTRTATAPHPMGSRTNMMSGGYPSSVNYPTEPIKQAQMPSSLNIYNIKLKALPFFDVMDTLLQPSSLTPTRPGSFQENMFQFTLLPSQVNSITMSKNENSSEYNIEIQMRFCFLDTTCEQEDNFPPSICVKVNDKVCTLPNPIPTNRPGVEPKRPSRPVNITSLCKLSPVIYNTINVSWASEYSRGYAVCIYLVRRLDSSVLLSRLVDKGVRDPDLTRTMIKEKLQQNPDSEIATTSLRGSLICPIGKMRMQIPCRATTCIHLQCFDANLFIKMNEKKPRWICPVCDKPSTFHSLAIDGLFSEIANKAPPNCTEVQFHADGSWTPILKANETHEVEGSFTVYSPVKKHAKKKQEIEVVDLASDSDTEDSWFPTNPQLDKEPLPVSFREASTSSSSPMSIVPPPVPMPSISPSIIPPFGCLSSPLKSIVGNAPSKSNFMTDSISLETGSPSMKNEILENGDSAARQNPGLANMYPYLDMNFLNSTDHRSIPPLPNYLSDSSEFDFYSLLQPLDSSDVSNTLSGTRRNAATPDIISLD